MKKIEVQSEVLQCDFSSFTNMLSARNTTRQKRTAIQFSGCVRTLLFLGIV